jgi:F-type H+-transporting ATPase subunit gamma
MATLREIKKRINNIAVIERITQSMKAVATSKLGQVKAIKENNKDFFVASDSIFNNLMSLQQQFSNTNNSLFNKIFTGLVSSNQTESQNQTPLIVIISSDRGLCGAYNSNVFRYANKYIKNLSNTNYKILAIGNKAYAWSLKNYNTNTLKMPISSDFKAITQDDFMAIVINAIGFIKMDQINEVKVIYTSNISMLSQEVKLKNLLPISNTASLEPKAVENKNIVVDELNFTDILEPVLIQYLAYELYQLFIKSAIAEYSSRMNAMDNASENSKELKDKLKLIYNRSRQGIITKELTEIIAGVEAS